MVSPGPLPAELLLEGVLPLVLETRGPAFQSFDGVVQVVVFEPTGPRAWTVRASDRPWVQRGAPERPDVTLEMTEALVLRALRGTDLNLDHEVKSGDLRLSGDPRKLERLGQILAGAERRPHALRAERSS